MRQGQGEEGSQAEGGLPGLLGQGREGAAAVGTGSSLNGRGEVEQGRAREGGQGREGRCRQGESGGCQGHPAIIAAGLLLIAACIRGTDVFLVTIPLFFFVLKFSPKMPRHFGMKTTLNFGATVYYGFSYNS